MASDQPPSLPVYQPTPRIGVFICDCGDKVSSILDVESLVEAAGELPGVVYAGHAPYWCSADGGERLQEALRAEELERVVVAGCSPRTHKRLFQETVAQAGLNHDLLGLVNIREGCAWPHRGEHKAATARARDQIEMEVVHVAALAPRPQVQAKIAPAALVIGGGVAGMTAALELADADVPVTLVERAVTLGGMATADAPELAADLIAAVQTHPGITLQLDSHITHVDGSVGAYHITITNHKSQITPANLFGAVIVATGTPDDGTVELAKMLRMTQDVDGFLPELRVRLRPGSYIERGIYVCGSSHYPCDAAEAQFQAYSAASRALRHLRQEIVTAHGSVAQVDPEKCNGCGDCFKVCPFTAVTMAERTGGLRKRPEQSVGLSLAVIDPLLCTGCSNCVSVCPVGAVTVAGWTDTQLEAQMRVALAAAEPRVLIFACEWSGYAAAELAGAQKLTYPPNVRMIRLDCSGRLQPGLILKAFEMGAAGVLLLGCEPKLCHYERGNERAAAVYDQVEALVGLLGLPPTRLQVAWTPPDDGPAFAELVTGFVKGVEETIEATA
jgi:heterodisulfide reductase subunit A-like polyferredoxin/coenzyme F420-reducing hydrogenase delta subunit